MSRFYLDAQVDDLPQSFDVDVCIVGAGPGGSAAAHTLSKKGRKVLLLEAGQYHPVESFRNDTPQALKTLYFNHGKKITDGNVNFAVLVGKGLGGGTLVNSGISFRPPMKTLRRWADSYGLESTTYEKLSPFMDKAEKILKVEVLTLDRLGVNNKVFAKGVQALGWSGSVIPRNTLGCMPCARCFYGCPTGAKQSTDKNFLPQAAEAGAQIVCNALVTDIRAEGGRIRSMQVRGKSNFEVRAKHFVLAAGALGSAKLLMKHGLANSSGQVGKNFRCHPTSGVMGKFPERIEAYKSILQGYFCDEFFEDEILLETAWAPADAVAALTPGVGEEYMQRLSQLNHFAMAGGMIREKGSGELKLTSSGDLKIKYYLTTNDFERLTKALYLSAEIMLAAGAQEVYADNPIQAIIRSAEDLSHLKKHHPNLGPTIVLEGNHAQGTLRMDSDPKKGVVSEFGRSFDIPNLWVMDSSVLPDALGVNPQITITALALRNSEYLDSNFG